MSDSPTRTMESPSIRDIAATQSIRRAERRATRNAKISEWVTNFNEVGWSVGTEIVANEESKVSRRGRTARKRNKRRRQQYNHGVETGWNEPIEVSSLQDIARALCEHWDCEYKMEDRLLPGGHSALVSLGNLLPDQNGEPEVWVSDRYYGEPDGARERAAALAIFEFIERCENDPSKETRDIGQHVGSVATEVMEGWGEHPAL